MNESTRYSLVMTPRSLPRSRVAAQVNQKWGGLKSATTRKLTSLCKSRPRPSRSFGGFQSGLIYFSGSSTNGLRQPPILGIRHLSESRARGWHPTNRPSQRGAHQSVIVTAMMAAGPVWAPEAVRTASRSGRRPSPTLLSRTPQSGTALTRPRGGGVSRQGTPRRPRLTLPFGGGGGAGRGGERERGRKLGCVPLS